MIYQEVFFTGRYSVVLTEEPKEIRMLKGIPDSISPDLIHTLMSMGHGDEIVLADGNFPAASPLND